MTLQQKTLQRYRHLFPNETLRETSARTNIQITRVFRLFNGKTMKVLELEAFESIINKKIGENPCYENFCKMIEEASVVLTNQELNNIAETISRKISLKNYSRFHQSTELENKIIA